MEIVYLESPITKSASYKSEIETSIVWNSTIVNLIVNNSIIQKIKYIISKVF